jgi:hypothetical protein
MADCEEWKTVLNKPMMNTEVPTDITEKHSQKCLLSIDELIKVLVTSGAPILRAESNNRVFPKLLSETLSIFI